MAAAGVGCMGRCHIRGVFRPKHSLLRSEHGGDGGLRRLPGRGGGAGLALLAGRIGRGGREARLFGGWPLGLGHRGRGAARCSTRSRGRTQRAPARAGHASGFGKPGRLPMHAAGAGTQSPLSASPHSPQPRIALHARHACEDSAKVDTHLGGRPLLPTVEAEAGARGPGRGRVRRLSAEERRDVGGGLGRLSGGAAAAARHAAARWSSSPAHAIVALLKRIFEKTKLDKNSRVSSAASSHPSPSTLNPHPSPLTPHPSPLTPHPAGEGERSCERVLAPVADSREDPAHE